MPSEPVSIAATSERMSPKRLSVTMTSYCFGQRTSCMAQLSASTCSSSTSANSAAWTRSTTFFQSTPDFMTLLFSAEETLLRRLPGEVEGDPRDALDLAGRVELGVDGALRAVLQGDDLLRLAEIDAAGEFAHDDDVEALDDLALQGRGVGEGRIADRRAQVGEEAEILAQAQQPGLGPRGIGHVRPFRAADGAEQDRVGGLRPGHRGLGDGDLVGVVGGAADEIGLGLEADAGLAEEGGDLLHLPHDFGADAVARQEKQLVGRHGTLRPGRGRSPAAAV